LPLGNGLSLSTGDIRELSMHKSALLGGAVGAAMLFGVTAALPADLRVAVGVELPGTVELFEVPAAIEFPAARRLRYTVVDRQVVLVDPSNRRVVRVIRQVQ
jgi:hypothetical protein